MDFGSEPEQGEGIPGVLPDGGIGQKVLGCNGLHHNERGGDRVGQGGTGGDVAKSETGGGIFEKSKLERAYSTLKLPVPVIPLIRSPVVYIPTLSVDHTLIKK